MLTNTDIKNPTLDFSTKEAALQTLATIEQLHLTGADLTRALPEDHSWFPNRTPLMIACELGVLEAAAFLIDTVGINPHDPITEKGVWEGATSVVLAARSNQVGILELLHKRNINLNQPVVRGIINEGKTPFFSACANNAVEAAAFLIDKIGVDPNEPLKSGLTKDFFTPSLIAVLKGHTEILELLHKRNVDFRQPFPSGEKKGELPIFTASTVGGESKGLEFLIDTVGLDPNEPLKEGPDKGHTAVIKAILSPSIYNFNALNAFHKRNINFNQPIAFGPDKGKTPLAIACANSTVKIVDFLISVVGLNPNTPLTEGEWEGYTPAMVAAAINHRGDAGNILELLRTKGVDFSQPIAFGPHKGKTILALTCAHGSVEAIDFLINKVTLDPRAPLTEGVWKGCTPVIVAAIYDNTAALKHLLNIDFSLSDAATALEKSEGTCARQILDFLVKDKKINTKELAKIACAKNYVKALKLLRDENVDLHQDESQPQQSLFITAVSHESYEAATFILSTLPPPHSPELLSVYLTGINSYMLNAEQRRIALGYFKTLVSMGFDREKVIDAVAKQYHFDFYTPVEKYLALYVLNRQSRQLLEQVMTKAKILPEGFECVVQANGSGEQIDPENLPHYLALTIKSFLSKLNTAALASPLQLKFDELLMKYDFAHTLEGQKIEPQSIRLSSDDRIALGTILHNLLIINNQLVQSMSESTWFQQHSDDTSVSIHAVTAELDPMDTEQDLEETDDLDPKDDQEPQDNPKAEEEPTPSPALLLSYRKKPNPLNPRCTTKSKMDNPIRRQ